MKKVVIFYFMMMVIAVQITALYSIENVNAAEQKVIPKEAIRLRILANSDLPGDQALKRRVRDKVNASITKWVSQATEIEQGRQIIQRHIPEIEQIVGETLNEAGSKERFKVEFNKRVKFPTKIYGNFIYPAGEYEAVLITLGDGAGANWWCVLFPPLCFLDFSNGEAVKVPGPTSTETLGTDVTASEATKEDTSIEDKLNKPVVEETKKPQNQVEVRFLLKDMYDALFQ